MKTTKPILILLFFILPIAQLVFSQNTNTISGTISDHSTTEKLTGVNIYIKGTTTGTVTNENGFYSLKVPDGFNVLVYSFIGYKAVEVNVSSLTEKNINIQLEADEELLGEVKITAQRRFFGNMDYGREIPTIEASVIAKQNANNASDILHARVAGVWSTKTSGAPGDQQKIRIRGQASFFSSAEPLYVIDGVPVPIVNLASLGIADLNIHDIDNVTVLKDASSSALYGYQGGNGVILIDTKQGNENKIEFSCKTGMQWFDNFYDLMDTKDFLASLEIAYQEINSRLKYFNLDYSETLCDHNRQEEIFKKGMVQEYQLSGSGNKNLFKYYLSGNYTKHEGILPGSEYERSTFNTRIGRLFGNKLAFDLSYRVSLQDNHNNQNEYNGNRLLFEGLSKQPNLESIPDSLIFQTEPYAYYTRIHNRYYTLNDHEYLQSIIDNTDHGLEIVNHAGSFFGRYQINRNWSIDAMESFLLRNTNYHSNSVVTISDWGKRQVNFISNEDVRLFNHQVNIAYNKTIRLNNIGLVLAHRYYTDNLWWNVDSLKNTLPSHYYLRNSMAGYGMKGSVIRRISSYLAHFSYSFRETYFLSAIANFSRLKEGINIDYYTLFPSLSASWDISNEPAFITVNWLDKFNLYANFGTSGNYPLNGLSNDLFEDVPFAFEGNKKSYLSVHQFANHFLKHESTTELDVGFKAALWKSKVKLNGALFQKDIGNQIIQRDIPVYYGGGKIFVNLGDIKVNGYEFGFEAFPVENKNFEWYLNGNFTKSKQLVTKLADGQDMLFYNSDILFPEFIVKEGEPLGAIYGYKCLGRWKDDQADSRLYLKKGNLKYLNLDSTNYRLDNEDKVMIGNSIPDFTWNLSSSFRYKDFSLDITLYSVWGNDKYNATRAGTIMTGVNREVLAFYNDSIDGINDKYFYESSLFIDDASFIRLKTVTLNYSPEKKFWGTQLSFSLSFENMITITRYNGFDPEATIYTDNNFSDNAIDRGAFPNPKGVFATINIKL